MSLIAPLFLLGLLALAIPWWLHLISTDDPPAQDFSSNMFLEQQQTVSSRQSRLRYLALLALRTLAIALLALLFAEPVLERLQAFSDKASRHLVVVDTSLSQSHELRWQRTQSRATDIINAIPAGDQIQVVAAGGVVQASGNNNFTATGNNDFTVTAAQAALAALQPGDQRLAFSQLANTVNALVKQSPMPVEVHIVSDMQQSAMPDRFSDLAITGIEKLHLYSTAANDDRNLSVTATVTGSADGQTDVTALLQNHSLQAATVDVSVSTNTSTIASRRVEIEPDSRTAVQFDRLNTRNAAGRLLVSISPNDDLPLDDQFNVAIPGGDRTDISVIGGMRNSIASTYVTAAIESDPRYRTRLLTGDRVNAAETGPLAIIPDASTLTDRGSSDLKDYIESGGTALVIVGSQPHSANMRSLLNITSTTEHQALPRIITQDISQPLVSGLANDWRSLSLQQTLSTAIKDTDRIILATDNNTPLLTERSMGEGQLLLFTSALDPLWNNLALEPLFVPFIIRSIEYLLGDSATAKHLSIGDSINIAAGAQLLNSEGESLRALTDLNQRGSFTFTDAGVYTVRSPAGGTYISINSDPLESSLTALNESQLDRWQTLGNSEATGNTGNAQQNTESTNQQSLWFWLLLSLLIVAMLESLYSHRHLWVKRGA